ncbi:hypothetical protein [Microbacterium sp. NPDC058345]|uniref:hypothetical protein n=1 Tax=Microbacterium sp. NPDC058345 TaxID=3346455 RepID=UPI00364C8710
MTALGLAAGLLCGFLIQDAVAIALVAGGALNGRAGDLPLELAMLFGLLMPTFAIIGVVVAMLVDRRIRRR